MDKEHLQEDLIIPYFIGDHSAAANTNLENATVDRTDQETNPKLALLNPSETVADGCQSPTHFPLSSIRPRELDLAKSLAPSLTLILKFAFLLNPILVGTPGW